MTTLTRNDVQSVVEQSRNRLMDQMVSRQDIQSLQDSVRSLLTIVQQNQILLRQSDNQYSQMVRRAAALENRMIMLEREIQQLRRTMVQKVDNSAQRVSDRVISAGTTGRFVYTPVTPLY